MFEPIDRGNLNQQILYSLKRYIIAEGLNAGDRLPPERELASSLGVSRNTLREALRSLQTVGMLSRTPGRGSILQNVDFGSIAEMSQFMMIRSSEDIDNLFVVRRILEVNILSLIAANATEEDYSKLESACDEMDRAIADGEIGTEADALFHQSLLDATHNQILSQLGVLIQEYLRKSRARVLIDTDAANNSVNDHRKIIDYLRDHNIKDAKELMKSHLNTYIQRGTVKAEVVLNED